MSFTRRQREVKLGMTARSIFSNHGAMPSHPTVECGICGKQVEKVVPLGMKFVCLTCKEKPDANLDQRAT